MLADGPHNSSGRKVEPWGVDCFCKANLTGKLCMICMAENCVTAARHLGSAYVRRTDE